MSRRRIVLIAAVMLVTATLACATPSVFNDTPAPDATPTGIPTALPPPPLEPGAANPDEPVFISGVIPFTSPFFLNGIAEPFVLLEDQAGFVQRNQEFVFPLGGQTIGPVELVGENALTYSIALPYVPQGTWVDVDNNGQADTGVQVFAVAYWSNTWGGPFLEERDGMGWSSAYASTITDAERDYEIAGGRLVVWSPDDEQAFPVGFGDDRLLFTDDDPTELIPAGYSIVDLDMEPFRIYKEPQPRIDLIEGEIALNDYSEMSYEDAFDALFEKATREYPFTEDKNIDWDALYEEFSGQVAGARSDDDFYRAIRDFTYAIPDAHVGVSFNANVFYEEMGGVFGMILAELGDGTVIVTSVLPGTPAAVEGIEVGAEIIEWDGRPVIDALRDVEPYFGPYSTTHHKQVEQAIFLTRVPPDTRVKITYQNPGASGPETSTLQAEVEYESLNRSLSFLTLDELSLPLQGEVLDESGFGYIQLTTFSGDYNLMARLWEHYITELNDNDVPGLIIDIRVNGGGNGALALDFAGYFFDEEIILSRRSYYNDLLGEFEYLELPSRVEPAPMQYDGPVVLLVGPSCVSACEGFAYAMIQGGRSTVVGHYPTAGAFGEVGRGQYSLPGDLSLQFPTGRPETLDGELLIEGVGIVPDITVPVTAESALGEVDTVLEAAIRELWELVGH